MTPNKSALFLATGDIGMNRENPDSIFDGVREVLDKGELVFGQLELCLTDKGSPAAQCRLPMRCHPSGGGAIKRAGYDVISFATNHCMDWGREGFSDTLDVLKRNGLNVIGAGEDIFEARKPYIAEINGAKVGFLGYNSILPQDYYATEDRPGCAPLRGHTLYEQIEHDQPGTPCRIHTFPHRGDLNAMLEDIDALRPKVDILVMSFHWGLHFIPAVLADYQRDIAYAAIDRGADIILGHHPHILKAIEVYKGKVIFYSLGNFALDTPDKFDSNVTKRKSHEAIKNLNPDMAKGGRIMPRDSYKTIICRADIIDGQLKNVGFIPVLIDEGSSNPRVLSPEEPAFNEVVDYLRQIGEDQGIYTGFTPKGDYVLITEG